MSIIIGIDHGYYAIKTAHCSFPAGLTSYGEHEPYTRQGLLEFGGCFFVCGSGRQPIQRDKTANDNYYLLTLAAIAKEIQQRGLPFAACGFFTYHGMTAEQVLWAWFKSEILCPKRLVFKSDTYYYTALQPAIRAGIKRKRGLPMKKNTHTSEETA